MSTTFLLSFLFESSWLLRNGLAATEDLDPRDFEYGMQFDFT